MTAPSRVGPISRTTSPNSAEWRNRLALSTTSRPRYASATRCAAVGSARNHRIASSNAIRFGGAPSGVIGSAARSVTGLSVQLETREDAREVKPRGNQHEQRVCDDAAPDYAAD